MPRTLFQILDMYSSNQWFEPTSGTGFLLFVPFVACLGYLVGLGEHLIQAFSYKKFEFKKVGIDDLCNKKYAWKQESTQTGLR